MIGDIAGPEIVEVGAGGGDTKGVVRAGGEAFADGLSGNFGGDDGDEDGSLAGNFAGVVGNGEGISARVAGETLLKTRLLPVPPLETAAVPLNH